MRKRLIWSISGLLIASILAAWGVWTWRLSNNSRQLALQLEAERQRNFYEMIYHVEQIQAMLGKGLVTGTTMQNMRYLGDVYHHSEAAMANFTSLPLPAELSALISKFLKQTGDFAVSVLRHEAAGREINAQAREELARLRQQALDLDAQLHALATKPQAPASMMSSGWREIGSAMERLPALLYDGPFSDHIDGRAPALSGSPITQAEGAQRASRYVPHAQSYRTVGVSAVGGNIPAYSFQFAPTTTTGTAYTLTCEVTKNGGFLLYLLNGRITGAATLDLHQAAQIGQKYLASIGYPGMVATYGQAEGGAATILYALHEQGTIIYPDQIKVKVALDTGEVLGVDARQYLMSHHTRSLKMVSMPVQEAEEALNPDLAVKRVQVALIPDQAGTSEILCYEFLTTYGNDTFLVYVNAETGFEEQILQQVRADGGTFVL